MDIEHIFARISQYHLINDMLGFTIDGELINETFLLTLWKMGVSKAAGQLLPGQG